MSRATRTHIKYLSAVALAASLCSCDKPAETTAATSTAASATQAPATATVSASAAKKIPKKKPSHPCPEGSKGEGNSQQPCEAKGTARIMEVKWTGKIDDKKGPFFKVTNKTDLEVAYGRIAVYFYGGDGKQLEVPTKPKPMPNRQCGGRIFGPPMKAKETATMTFSCVSKKIVPEGAKAIEAEIHMVGFTGKDSKKADTYWQNKDLIPKERPKGGAK